MLLSCFGIAQAWQSDNGDGSYTNPVLYADYSDPDITRVGPDFYMVSSSFVASPGLTVLKSKDMVNWEFAGHAADPVGTGDEHDMVNGQTAYERGFWAPSIRHRNGVFYIAVQPTFANGRIYYASNPAGPWNFHQLDRNIYDPGFFIDSDGTGYILSGHGPQSLMVLNSTYSAVVAQYDNHVNSGGEGTHLVKRGSWYYAFNANPGVWPFQLRCSRTQDLVNGPWETGHICLTATTGGHQGAIVDVNDSDQWYGFVHQDSGAIGRMPRIGPVFWENNWPVFGTPSARDVMGATYPKPVAGQPVKVPATSDDFSSSSLGLQWQWNHNPDASKWSLTERPGHLRLRPGQASEFWKARNTLTQKSQGPRSQGVVKLDLSAMQPGDIAGFGTLGKVSAHLAVTAGAGGSRTLSMKMRNDKVGEYTAATGVAFSGNTLYLRTDLDFTRSLGVCAYSTDGTNWTTLGGNFPLMFGYGSTWQGEQFALFSYNPDTASSSGHVDVDSFTFSTLGDSADLVKTQRGRAKLNAARTTFVADNGQLLRGPYESTEWTTAADSTGNGWNGTLVNGPAWVAGRRGNAVSLDGANDHISLPAGVVAGLTDFTLSAWVKLDAANHWVRVFDFGSGTDNYLFLTTSHGTSGIPRFAIRTPSTGEQIIDGDTVFPVGVWAHVAVTLSGSTGTLYVNGTAVGTNAGITLKPSDLGHTPANYLGKSQWADPYFDGLIEDFRIHDRALSATAISALLAQPAQSVGPIGEAELRAPLLSISGGIGSVTVPVSVVGRLYQLQSSETLAEESWVDLGDAQAGNGGSVVFSITVDSSDPRRFYRILIHEN